VELPTSNDVTRQIETGRVTTTKSLSRVAAQQSVKGWFIHSLMLKCIELDGMRSGIGWGLPIQETGGDPTDIV